MNIPERRPMSRWAFLLAHHWPEELDRCWKLKAGRRFVFVCARCAGLYPVMLGVMIWLFLVPVEAGWYDWLWLFVPGLPALVDWSQSRLGSRTGSNLRRSATGAGLGFALGRALYLHMLHPFNPPVVVLLGFLSLWVLSVELLRRRRMAHRGRGEH